MCLSEMNTHQMTVADIVATKPYRFDPAYGISGLLHRSTNAKLLLEVTSVNSHSLRVNKRAQKLFHSAVWFIIINIQNQQVINMHSHFTGASASPTQTAWFVMCLAPPLGGGVHSEGPLEHMPTLGCLCWCCIGTCKMSVHIYYLLVLNNNFNKSYYTISGFSCLL